MYKTCITVNHLTSRVKGQKYIYNNEVCSLTHNGQVTYISENYWLYILCLDFQLIRGGKRMGEVGNCGEGAGPGGGLVLNPLQSFGWL